MQINIIEEAGYNTALYGFSLSYKDRAIPREEWWIFDGVPVFGYLVSRERQIQKTATANAGRGSGHDKWLRQVMVWVDVEAPRYWWSEFDTYKVGTVAQSESTMHTLMKRDVNQSDFDAPIGALDGGFLQSINMELQYARKINNIQWAKQVLPESYKQRRVVSLNYAVLRCIIEQRKNHKLPEWKQFIDAIYEQCEHSELLPKRN